MTLGKLNTPINKELLTFRHFSGKQLSLSFWNYATGHLFLSLSLFRSWIHFYSQHRRGAFAWAPKSSIAVISHELQFDLYAISSLRVPFSSPLLFGAGRIANGVVLRHVDGEPSRKPVSCGQRHPQRNDGRRRAPSTRKWAQLYRASSMVRASYVLQAWWRPHFFQGWGGGPKHWQVASESRENFQNELNEMNRLYLLSDGAIKPRLDMPPGTFPGEP